MYEFAETIPDVELLLALQPEELGAKMLFLLQKRGPAKAFLPRADLPMLSVGSGHPGDYDVFHPQHLIAELWLTTTIPNQQTPYPRERQAAVEIAETEALAWLEAQGLIIPASGTNGQNGW